MIIDDYDQVIDLGEKFTFAFSGQHIGRLITLRFEVYIEWEHNDNPFTDESSCTRLKEFIEGDYSFEKIIESSRRYYVISGTDGQCVYLYDKVKIVYQDRSVDIGRVIIDDYRVSIEIGGEVHNVIDMHNIRSLVRLDDSCGYDILQTNCIKSINVCG